MKRLVAYGCSWTEGEGSDVSIESTLSPNEKRIFRNTNSWPQKLSDLLDISTTINRGVSGNSNRKIFNDIIKDVENKNVTSDDFVCIMFSSSLRDYVPFLPQGEWVSWSVKHLLETPDRFYNSYDEHGVSSSFNNFLSKYKRFFVTNLFNQEYYNMVNQNYIIFLQKLFEEYDIKYMMCESFEYMVQPPLNSDFTEHIHTNTIFGELKLTLRDLLNELNRKDIWEHVDRYDTRATQHPNKEGYKIIADELFNFIKSNKVI